MLWCCPCHACSHVGREQAVGEKSAGPLSRTVPSSAAVATWQSIRLSALRSAIHIDVCTAKQPILRRACEQPTLCRPKAAGTGPLASPSVPPFLSNAALECNDWTTPLTCWLRFVCSCVVVCAGMAACLIAVLWLCCVLNRPLVLFRSARMHKRCWEAGGKRTEPVISGTSPLCRASHRHRPLCQNSRLPSSHEESPARPAPQSPSVRVWTRANSVELLWSGCCLGECV